MPISANSASVADAGRSITTPSASSTSAEPHAEDAARLPCLTIDAAKPDISAAVSPFARSATPNPAICAGVALPSMISFMAQAVCSAVSACLPISARISAGQLGVSIYLLLSCDGGRGASRRSGAGAHERGQLAGERDRVDRMADHRVGLG